MDKIVERSKWSKSKPYVFWSAGALLFVTLILWLALKDTSPEIEMRKIRVGEVQEGDFQEIIVANGSIEPKKTVLIDANEGGTVEEIMVEEGDLVSAGDVLLVLTNESLMLDYMQRETQIVEQINNLRNTRINLHQNLRQTEDQLDEFERQLAIVSKQYYRDSVLVSSNGVSMKTFEESKVNYNYSSQQFHKLKKRKSTDHTYHGVQIARIDKSIRLMERNLQLIREKLSEMTVKAPISGKLNSFDLERGEVLKPNQTIARVDVPGKYCIRALVDQHYINRLRNGQLGKIIFDGKTYELSLRKVLSTIENGQAEIFLDFSSGFPENLRRGQNFQVQIEISGEKRALKLPKGSFYQSSGGKYVYVLSKDGKRAEKCIIEIGRQNPEFYEVISGLNTGQKVVISSYESFNQNNTIRIITKDT